MGRADFHRFGRRLALFESRARLPLAALFAVIVMPLPGLAQCDFPEGLFPPAATFEGEIQRLRQILETCERPRNDAEQLLFTWGHGRKLEYLRTRPVLESCAFNREREAVRNRYGLAPAYRADYPVLRELAARIQDAGSSNLWAIRHGNWAPLFPPQLGVEPEQLRAARMIAMIEFAYPEFEEALTVDPEDRRVDLLARIAEAEIHSEVLAELIDHRDDMGALEQRLAEDDDLAQQAREALEEEIEALGLVIEELEETLAETDGLNDLEEVRIQGKLVGLNLVIGADAATFTSSSSYGYGVYLSTDPLAFLGHFASPEHAGVVCDFQGGAPNLEVVDWTDLDDLAALRRYPAADAPQPALGVIAPGGLGLELGGYNNYIHPRAFDQASHARLIAIGRHNATPIYLDRCAIDYRAPSCREFRVSDLTCAQATTLFQRPELDRMNAYFAATDPDQQFLQELQETCPGMDLDLY